MIVPSLLLTGHLLTALPVSPSYLIVNAAQQEESSATPLSNDPRLKQKLTIAKPDITIKEALAIISQQLGIPLKVLSRDPIFERKIILFVTDKPADDLLEALAHLLAYKNSRCYWEPTRVSEDEGYLLRYSGSYESMAKTIDRAGKEALQQDVSSARTLMNTSPDQLPKLAKDNFIAGILLQEDTIEGGSYRLALNAFFNGLSEQQQQEVLQGKPVTLLYETAPATIRKYMDSARDKTSPPEITFLLRKQVGQFSSQISIEVGDRGQVLKGGSPQEEIIQDLLFQSWLTKQDKNSSPEEDKKIPAPASQEKEESYGQAMDTAAVSRLFSEIHQRSHLDIIALLPEQIPMVAPSYVREVTPEGVTRYFYATFSSVQRSPSGKTLTNILKGLQQGPYQFRHKWYGDTLLLRNPLEPFYNILTLAPK